MFIEVERLDLSITSDFSLLPVDIDVQSSYIHTYFMMPQLRYIINIYYSYILMCCDVSIILLISYTGCICSASQWHVINFKLKGICGGITPIYAEKKLHDEFTAE